MSEQCDFCPQTKASSFLCDGGDCTAAKASYYKTALIAVLSTLENDIYQNRVKNSIALINDALDRGAPPEPPQ